MITTPLMRLRHFIASALAFLGILKSGSDPASAQQPPDPNYVRQPVFASYSDFRAAVAEIVAITDPAIRTTRLDAFWMQLRDAGQVPYAIGDRVAFLYRGGASNVAVRGDFNNWGTTAAVKQGSTDLWMLERTLPSDARSDYKLFLNQNQWVLDPGNRLQIWSGFGPNSELRMPDYTYPRETVRRATGPQGTLSPNIRMTSSELGYDVQFRVYTPPGYDSLDDLPAVYVTDGHEYSADYLGSMPIVLDNLIQDGRLRPAIAVFIDPRDPHNLANNRRAEQYVANDHFVDFVTRELVPRIDRDYDTDQSPAARTIMGTSLGGLNAAYFGATADDVFGHLGIQSPAFQVYPQIYDRYRTLPRHNVDIFLSGGTLGDNASSRTLLPILETAGYAVQHLEVHEGHSWGAWRAQLDELLIYAVGPPIPEPAVGAVLPGILWGVARSRRR